MKLKPVVSSIFIGLFALAVILPTWEEFKPVVEPKIKEAKAEQTCPAEIPNASSTIRSGSPSGPIVGTFQAQGWNTESGTANPIYQNITVPSGTVLYYSNSITGFTGPNRATGGTHGYYGGGATVTSPSTKAGSYPSGYYFTRHSSSTGYTNAITASGPTIVVAAHYSCWGGFDDGEVMLQIKINVQGAPPAPTRKTFSNSLAIVKNPTVDLNVNTAGQTTGGQDTINITAGDRVNLNWTTDSVNLGDSCTASNLRGDPSWNGSKVGQTPFTQPNPPPASGGNQLSEPFNSAGTYRYTIQCYGLNNVPSTPSFVDIIVAPGVGGITCSVTQGNVVQGTPAQYVIGATGSAMNGSLSVTMSATPSSSPAPTLVGSPLTLNSGNSYTSLANVSTTGVPPQPYTLTFSAVSNTTPPATYTCTASLTVTAAPPPLPTVIFKYNGLETTPQTVSLGANNPLSWDSENADTCEAFPATAGTTWGNPRYLPMPDNSQLTGPLTNLGEYVFTIKCSNVTGFVEKTIRVNVVPGPAPTLTFTYNESESTPQTVGLNENNPLGWETQYADTCTAIPSAGTTWGTPSNLQVPNGTQLTGPLTEVRAYPFTIRCSNATGNVEKTIVVNVVAGPTPPSVIFKYNGSETTPQTVSLGANNPLSWVATGADTCEAVPPTSGTNWGTPRFLQVPSGSQLTGPLTTVKTYDFSIKCTNASASVTKTIEVIVEEPPVLPATVDLKCKGLNEAFHNTPPNCMVEANTAGTLTWTSSNTDYCEINDVGNGLPTNSPVAGVSTGNITTTPKTFTISCYGSGNPSPVQDSVTFEFLPPEPTDPPSVIFKCHRFQMDPGRVNGTCIVDRGTTGQLSWRTFYTDPTCSLKKNGVEIGPVNSFLVGRMATDPITITTVYTLTCKGPGSPPDGIGEVTFEPQDPIPDDWSCEAMFPQTSIARGTSGSNTITTSVTGNFNSPVTLSTSDIAPVADGITITYDPNGVVPPRNDISAVINVPLTASIRPHEVTVMGVPVSGPTRYCTFIINVTGTASLPTVDLKCSVDSGPVQQNCNFNDGQTGKLTWEVTNATYCEINPGIGSVGVTPAAGNTGVSVGVLTNSITYTLGCRSADMLPTDPLITNPSSFIENILPTGPIVNLKCSVANGPVQDNCTFSAGQNAQLTWTATNADSCTLTDFGSVSPSAGGVGVTAYNLQSTRTYVLGCTGPGSSPPGTPTNDPSTLTLNTSSDWSCRPWNTNVSIAQGTSGSNIILTEVSGGFSSPITLSTGSIAPGASGISIAYSPNPMTPPSNDINALISVAGNVAPGSYTVTVRGVPRSGPTHDCATFRVTVFSVPPPVAPVVTTDTLSSCDAVIINWRANGSPQPTSYQVFRGRSANVNDPSYVAISPSLITFTWTDTIAGGAQQSNNYYKVRGYLGSRSVDSTPGVLGNVKPCAPVLTKSDKDILKVTGRNNQTFLAIECSGETESAKLNNNALFAPDDILTFQINICNTGSGPLTNVTVEDTLTNLKDVSFNFPLGQTASTADCIKGPPSYNSRTGKISIVLADVAPNSVCDIRFTAKIAAPNNPDAGLYRFQNTAWIRANEITPAIDPVLYAYGYYEVETPPYIYSLTGGVPLRNETAPSDKR